MKQRIVLAYSGSAESTSAIRGSPTQHRAEVVTLTVDVGQGGELAAGPRPRAGGRRRAGPRDRCARGVRARVCAAGAAGGRRRGRLAARSSAR